MGKEEITNQNKNGKTLQVIPEFGSSQNLGKEGMEMIRTLPAHSLLN